MPRDFSSRHLIVRLRNWVGDVVLSVPGLQLLEQQGFRLHLLGPRWAPALLAGFEWDVRVRGQSLSERVVQYRSLARECRASDPGFDRRCNSLLMPTSFSSALETRLAGLRSAGWAAEGRSVLLAKRLARSPLHHELARYFDLCSQFLNEPGLPSAPLQIAWRNDPRAQEGATHLLRAQGIDTKGFIVLCPFAGGLVDKQEKTWPAFAEFSHAAHQLGIPLVALPGPGEDRLLEGFAPIKVMKGVDLGTYGAILARARLMISNDTGPAHLAAAVGTPVLSVLGPTKPEQWAPWGPQVRIVRHWPRWPTVDEVLFQAEAMLTQADHPSCSACGASA